MLCNQSGLLFLFFCIILWGHWEKVRIVRPRVGQDDKLCVVAVRQTQYYHASSGTFLQEGLIPKL